MNGDPLAERGLVCGVFGAVTAAVPAVFLVCFLEKVRKFAGLQFGRPRDGTTVTTIPISHGEPPEIGFKVPKPSIIYFPVKLALLELPLAYEICRGAGQILVVFHHRLFRASHSYLVAGLPRLPRGGEVDMGTGKAPAKPSSERNQLSHITQQKRLGTHAPSRFTVASGKGGPLTAGSVCFTPNGSLWGARLARPRAVALPFLGATARVFVSAPQAELCSRCTS